MLTLPRAHWNHWAGVLNFSLLRLDHRRTSYAFSQRHGLPQHERGQPATCHRPASELLASVIAASMSLACLLHQHCVLVIIIVAFVIIIIFIAIIILIFIATVRPLFKRNSYIYLYVIKFLSF
jgi:hypothetical protein